MNSISVIIPTFNRGEMLEKVVSNILKSSLDDNLSFLEVIVVDDSSTIPASESLGSLKVDFPFSLYILRQVNSGPAAARMNGLSHAKGDLIIFIDDDVLIDNNTLMDHLEAHRRLPNSVVYGHYPYFSPQKSSPAFRFLQKLVDDPVEKMLGENPEIEFVKVDTVASGNLSIPRNLFNDNGKFYDISLSTPAAEEYDLMYSLKKRNIPIYFALTKLKAWHLQPATISAKCSQEFKYGVGIAEVCIKKKEVLNYTPIRNLYLNNLISSKKGSLVLQFKIVLRYFLSLKFIRLSLMKCVSFFEIILPFDLILFPFYRLVIGLNMLAGVRKGVLMFKC